MQEQGFEIVRKHSTFKVFQEVRYGRYGIKEEESQWWSWWRWQEAHYEILWKSYKNIILEIKSSEELLKDIKEVEYGDHIRFFFKETSHW